ncbi:hypothetical protein SDC9_154169 [bioreactor metagenome]|uniref:Uncharacterized protein n=1 Tax=bioreactor metagenome TaxID=1076179 RepID=A0A645F082_9ZZZZ
MQQRPAVGHIARQIGKVQVQGAADLVDARQRHVALGQHALDAGFGHAYGLCQVGIGHLRGLEFFLDSGDEIGGRAHGIGW